MKLKLVLLVSFTALLLTGCTEKGNVMGEATYAVDLHKPAQDAGAKVYFLNSMDGNGDNIEAFIRMRYMMRQLLELDTVLRGYVYSNPGAQYFQWTYNSGQLLVDTLLPFMLKQGSDIESDSLIMSLLNSSIQKAEDDLQNVIAKGTVVVADDKGRYTAELKPGKYFMLAVSGNIKGKSVLEQAGMLECDSVTVVPNEGVTRDVFMSPKFVKMPDVKPGELVPR